MIVVVIIYYYLDIKVFDIFDRHTHLQSTYGCYFAAMLDYREENVFWLLSFGSSLRIAGWSTTLPYANCSGPYSPLGKRQRGRIHDLQTYYVGGPMTRTRRSCSPDPNGHKVKSKMSFFWDGRVEVSVVGFSWESCLPVHFCKTDSRTTAFSKIFLKIKGKYVWNAWKCFIMSQFLNGGTTCPHICCAHLPIDVHKF